MSAEFEKALAAHQAGDFAAAERGYLPFRQYRNVAQNLAALYNETGRPEEAEALLRVLVENFPDFAPARHSLSLSLLAQRKYAEGFGLYESRWPAPNIPAPQTRCPAWAGEPLAGRRIAVLAEQGLGDQLMFGRYLPALRAEGAEVLVGCDPVSVAPVFEANGWATAPFEAGGEAPAADVWTFVGSLPLRLGSGPPPAPAYLTTPRPRGGGGVGVVATGSPTHRYDRYRSLSPEHAAELLRLGRNLHPDATGAKSLLETAEIVAGLDLVIAVDTSIVHLAGALGTPCWVLLSQIGQDFRWNDGRRSDWYPEHRLFRQAAPGEWGPVLAEVRRALG